VSVYDSKDPLEVVALASSLEQLCAHFSFINFDAVVEFKPGFYHFLVEMSCNSSQQTLYIEAQTECALISDIGRGKLLESVISFRKTHKLV